MFKVIFCQAGTDQMNPFMIYEIYADHCFRLIVKATLFKTVDSSFMFVENLSK